MPKFPDLAFGEPASGYLSLYVRSRLKRRPFVRLRKLQSLAREPTPQLAGLNAPVPATLEARNLLPQGSGAERATAPAAFFGPSLNVTLQFDHSQRGDLVRFTKCPFDVLQVPADRAKRIGLDGPAGLYLEVHVAEILQQQWSGRGHQERVRCQLAVGQQERAE